MLFFIVSSLAWRRGPASQGETLEDPRGEDGRHWAIKSEWMGMKWGLLILHVQTNLMSTPD